MKKQILLAFAFILINGMAQGQVLPKFLLEKDTVYANGSTADFEIVGEINLVNETPNNLTLRWLRTQNNLSAGWVTAVCYLGGTCFGPMVDSATFTMPASATSGFSMHFMNNSTLGAGTTTLMVFEPTNRAAAQKVTFIARAFTAGTNQPSIATLSTYPNPAQNQIQVQTPENNGTITLTNLQGQSVLVQNTSQKNNVLNIENLPQSIYVLTFKGATYKAIQRIEKI